MTSREKRIINSLAPKDWNKDKDQARQNEGFILPNVSGDHSKSIVRDTPTQDVNIANKKYVDDSVGGGTGTMTTVKENGTQLGGADITTLDFLGADFDLTETPDKEVNISIARSAISVDLDTLGAAGSDGQFIVATGAGVFAYESGATALTSIGGIGAATTDTLTNKTLTSPVMNVTSDATGDIYYRNSGGLFTRLGVGSNAEVLTLASGLPSWAAAGGSGKETKVAVTAWSSTFSTTSATEVDVTGATVTLSGLTAGKTYSLIGLATFNLKHGGGEGEAFGIKIKIDDTIKTDLDLSSMGANLRYAVSLLGVKTGVTGETSYTVHLACESDGANTLSVNTTPVTQSIMLIAIEE